MCVKSPERDISNVISPPPPRPSVIPLSKRKKPSQSWENLEDPGGEEQRSRSSSAQLAEVFQQEEGSRTPSRRTDKVLSLLMSLEIIISHW